MKIPALATLCLPMAHCMAVGEYIPLETREAPSSEQQWCVSIGSLLTGIGAMATAAAAWYVAINNRHTCSVNVKFIHDKREDGDHHFVLSDFMVSSGYHPIERSEFFNESDAGHGLDTAHFSDGITDLIIGNDTDGGSIATIATRNTLGLESRSGAVGLVRMGSKFYGVPSQFFNCHTTSTHQDFKEAMDRILRKTSHDHCGASCYILDHGNNWRDALKIEQHRHDASGYHKTDRKCHGYEL